ncbi:MAG: SRPBCC family protein [Actinomycetota bacterium]|nr:SRPBCC family protein [Actinomycetota bacterium]
MPQSSFSVERSLTIPAPESRIFPLLADFHEWQKWSPWEGLDPQLHREYDGPRSGVGARYSWSGNRKAGSGSMEIQEAHEPSDLRIRLVFVKPWKADNQTTFELRPVGDQTRVTWRMNGTSDGVAGVFGKLFNMDKLVGRDFEKGLAQLSAQVSEQPTS